MLPGCAAMKNQQSNCQVGRCSSGALQWHSECADARLSGWSCVLLPLPLWPAEGTQIVAGQHSA